MRLTSLTDYSMRLMMYLDQHPERLCTIAEVASYHGISEAHLMKITHLLAKGEWIITQRGKNGGMKLAKPSTHINLGKLIRYMESDLAVVECLGTQTQCVLSGQCRLTGILNQALQHFLQHLDQYTLADLLPPLCQSAMGEQSVFLLPKQ